MSSYKYCIVPRCENTSVVTPEKLFFCVPKDQENRKKWCSLMRRDDPRPLSNKSTLYCCEDHFDMETDMENYQKFKMMGGLKKLKKDVVPHKFACQRRENETVENMNNRNNIDLLSDTMPPNSPHCSTSQSVGVQNMEKFSLKNPDAYALSAKHTLRFLGLYKEERVLWDPNHKEYTKRIKRREAIERITDRLRISLPDLEPRHIRLKIKSYRDKYTKELKKQQLTGSKGPYWFSQMSFLESKILQQSTECSQLDENAALLRNQREYTDNVSCDGSDNCVYDITIKEENSDDEEKSEVEEKIYDEGKDGMNDNNKTEFYVATTNSAQNTSKDTATLESVKQVLETVRKDQKIMLNLLKETKEDSKEDFCDKIGNYLATLMKMLPKSRVYALQPQLVAMITSELETLAANEEQKAFDCN